MTYSVRGFGAVSATSADVNTLGTLNARWGQMSGARGIAVSLASLASLLEALRLLHQSAHWQTRGPTYYGDHLLFQRLYEGIPAEIDSLGERAVGLGNGLLVCPITTAQLSADLLVKFGKGHGLDSPERLVALGLGAEKQVLAAVRAAMKDPASDGVQNLLQGIADKHEGSVYLLQQRLAKGG